MILLEYNNYGKKQALWPYSERSYVYNWTSISWGSFMTFRSPVGWPMSEYCDDIQDTSELEKLLCEY